MNGRDIPDSVQEQMIWGPAAVGGLGLHAMWGFSPSFDVLEPLPLSVAAAAKAPPAKAPAAKSADDDEEDDEDDDPEPINVLLVSPADIRHVLTTISRRRRVGGRAGAAENPKMRRPIHFYIYEPVPEVLARHLLLLQLVHDWELPVRQRARTFLEVARHPQRERTRDPP